jgi:hypothetical protein
MYTEADIRYIEDQFVPLAELCRARGVDVHDIRRRIVAGELPLPPYRGHERVPENYLDLPDADEFVRRYRGTQPEADLEAYLAGTYFVCVVDATPENIARKEELVTELRELLADPRPDDGAWTRETRTRIDELDELERPFSPNYDRTRFAKPLTRDELIEAPRRRWPELVARAVLQPR